MKNQLLPTARDIRPLLLFFLLGMGLLCGQSWGADMTRDAVALSKGQWLPLPDDLTPEQRMAAQRILDESEPRLLELHADLIEIMKDLRNLSFANDTHDDALSQLGVRLVTTRDTLFNELAQLRSRLQKEAGFTPEWDFQRGCNNLQRP